WPGGLVLSMATLNASSFVSLVISSTGAVTLGGRPSRVTLAVPAKGGVCCSLQYRSVVLPCSPAARSMAKLTEGGAISRVASWDETHTGPLPTGAVAITAVFHLRTWAFEAALIGNSTSFCPSGMVTPLAEPTPGGLNNG